MLMLLSLFLDQPFPHNCYCSRLVRIAHATHHLILHKGGWLRLQNAASRLPRGGTEPSTSSFHVAVGLTEV